MFFIPIPRSSGHENFMTNAHKTKWPAIAAELSVGEGMCIRESAACKRQYLTKTNAPVSGVESPGSESTDVVSAATTPEHGSSDESETINKTDSESDIEMTVSDIEFFSL